MAPGPREDRSLGELFADLTAQTTTLVRQEIALARVELGQKAGEVGRDLAFLAVGGAVAYAGFLGLLAALALVLIAAGLPHWLAALIVGLIVIVAGALLVQRGLTNLRQVNLAPTQTIETLRADASLAKEQTR